MDYEIRERLVVIPARGGSKGLPKKNIKILNGKCLIYYSIDAAREVVSDDDICITTDDIEIKETVENYGLKVPFLRPAELATDSAETYSVLLHALNYYESLGIKYKRLILLQPTSPLRKGKHVKEADQLYSSEIDMVVSVKETKSNPYYLLFEENEKGFLVKSKDGDFVRRQDCPKVWEFNGAVYIINSESLRQMPLNKFKRVVKYEMDEYSSFDIDDEMDWKIILEYTKQNGI
ncbi:N-acylneuraminate cytidylyltransferase [Marinilabilia salmonicolor]|jgi:N-acylneuraminate cytidylyltransferase|uniref:acylneuraminate cytidylyltransferase family protein n=1 Tax=Marinilabilia salmonicolor TaxID=989 RepID=UPI000D04ACCC|nr:acylneuraminate cytidylyltransferase family protein [Marinilabilia salmonicolor]PRY94367.1 N-acylneuraminate cytidylyltransferase [Marinilabilia salmonicolor]